MSRCYKSPLYLCSDSYQHICCFKLVHALCCFAVEDTTNLPPSPPPSPAAEHFGPLEQGRLRAQVSLGQLISNGTESAFLLFHNWRSRSCLRLPLHLGTDMASLRVGVWLPQLRTCLTYRGRQHIGTKSVKQYTSDVLKSSNKPPFLGPFLIKSCLLLLILHEEQ